jgi:hypothetical protein
MKQLRAGFVSYLQGECLEGCRVRSISLLIRSGSTVAAEVEKESQPTGTVFWDFFRHCPELKPVLHTLLTFQKPNLIYVFFRSGRLSKASVQVRGFLRSFVTSLFFLRRGVLRPTANHKAGGSPLVGCPRLLIQYIHSYPPYLEAVFSIRILKTRHTVVTKDSRSIALWHIPCQINGIWTQNFSSTTWSTKWWTDDFLLVAYQLWMATSLSARHRICVHWNFKLTGCAWWRMVHVLHNMLFALLFSLVTLKFKAASDVDG